MIFYLVYMVADKEAVKNNKNKPAKRDSVLRINLAVALTPYRFNAVFNQSPLNAGNSPWRNASTSALIHREVSHTAYQYPFALNYQDCKQGNGPQWTKALLEAIGQLSDVAGGHARSYYEMSPASIVLRLTPNLVSGYNTYGFDEAGNFPELERVNKDDLPGCEFWVGGEIARNMDSKIKERLSKEGVKFFDNPQKLLADVAEEFFKSEGN